MYNYVDDNNYFYTCSAGVGRTGTLITIQSMMKMIEHENKVDIFNFVLNMRHQRNLMVQTEVNIMNALTTIPHSPSLHVYSIPHSPLPTNIALTE